MLNTTSIAGSGDAAVPKTWKESGLTWLWLAALFLVLDQVTKLAVVANFNLYEVKEILPFFNLYSTRNEGAAFSFLADQGGWQKYFFAGIAIFASSLLLWWLSKTPKSQKVLVVSYNLILAGALGNLYDRLAYGYVIDFLDFFIGNSHFPAFNIADSAICVGAALLIWDAIFEDKAK